MSKYHDIETEEHGTRPPTQRGEERDPKRLGRTKPESVQPLHIQRVTAQSSYSQRAVQRAVQRFLQRSGSAQSPPQPEEDLGARIQMHAGGGTGLDPSAKGKLEGALGADLSGVRVHDGGEADQMARSVDSVAFTSGRDIFFREGAYNPGTSDGMRLLAHEATHTVQQSQGPVAGTPTGGGVAISDPLDSFEQAATRTAERVIEDESGSSAPIRGHDKTEGAENDRQAVQREAAPATEDMGVRNWPATLPRATSNENRVATDGQQLVLERLRRYRAQLIEDSGQQLIDYGRRYNVYPVYNGKSQGDPDPSQLNVPVPEETKREIHINWLMWSELKGEGGASSINIWDDQLQEGEGGDIGAGQVRDILQTLFDAKEISDPAARAMFLDAGVALNNGKLLVADTEKGVVEEGSDALELLRLNKALLSMLVASAEDPARGRSVVSALYKAFKRHTGKVPDFVYREWREDRDDSIVVLAHLSHWLPSFGWDIQPSEYQKTYGDLEKILIAFGKLAGQLQSPSGAYIVYDYLKMLDEDHLGRFGEGVDKKGMAMEAFKGQAPLELTAKEIAEDMSYHDHVFFPIPSKAAYYALPAVPTPPEKGKEPPTQPAPAKTEGSDSSGDKDKGKDKGKGNNNKGGKSSRGK